MLISTVLPILAWMSLSWTVNQHLKKGYAAGLLLTASAIILVLFLGMILGALHLTYYLIIVGAFIHAIFRGWTFRDLKNNLRPSTFTFEKFRNSYTILYMFGFIAVILFARKVYPDFVFFGWDEFSHWARYTKILVNTSVAPINDPAVLFPEYPPGINLWHYFICGPDGYSEWKVVFSQMLLVIATIICISTNFGKLKGLGTVAIFAFGLMIYHAFGTSLYEIYTDCILGLLFAAALLIARNIADESTNKAAIIGFGLVLATISLIKPIAILFSIAACGLFFSLRLTDLISYAFKKRLIKNKSNEATKASDLGLDITKPTKFLQSLFQTVQYLIASFSTVIIWKVYTKANSVKAQLADSQQVGLSEVIEFLFTRDTKETQIAWKELGDRIGFERISTFGGKQFRLDNGFFSPDIPIYHGAIYLLWVTLALFLVRVIFNHRKTIYIAAEAVYTSATFLIYLMVVVFITRYFFQLYDIERLASLERYLSSYLIGIMLYALTTLISDISGLKVHRYSKIQAVTMPIIWSVLSCYFIYKAPVELDNVFAKPLSERAVPAVHPWVNEYDELLEIRAQIKTLSNIVKSKADPHDKIYVVAQNETGFTFYMTGHELSPLETNRNCFSVGEKYYENDNWTCDWTNFPVLLKDYDYLVIRRADEAFWRSFGHIFEPAAQGYASGVFSIDKTSETVSLKSLYLSKEARGEGSLP